MKANLFEHTHAHWAKYSDYEWRTAPDGHDYLLPTADAKPSVYDPIPQADALSWRPSISGCCCSTRRQTRS